MIKSRQAYNTMQIQYCYFSINMGYSRIRCKKSVSGQGYIGGVILLYKMNDMRYVHGREQRFSMRSITVDRWNRSYTII